MYQWPPSQRPQQPPPQQPPPYQPYPYLNHRQNSSGSGSGIPTQRRSYPDAYQYQKLNNLSGSTTASSVGTRWSGNAAAPVSSPHFSSSPKRWCLKLLCVAFVFAKVWLALAVPVENSLDFWEQVRYLSKHPTGNRIPSIDALLSPFPTGPVELRTEESDPLIGATAWLPLVITTVPVWIARLAHFPHPLLVGRAFLATAGATAISAFAASVANWLGSSLAGIACLCFAAAAPGVFGAEALGAVALPCTTLACLISGRGSWSFALSVIGYVVQGPVTALPLVPVAIAGLPSAKILKSLLLSTGAVVAALAADFLYSGSTKIPRVWRHYAALRMQWPDIKGTAGSLLAALPELELCCGGGALALAALGCVSAAASVLRITSPSLRAVGGRLSVRHAQFFVILLALPLALLLACHTRQGSPDLVPCVPYLLLTAVAGVMTLRARVGDWRSSKGAAEEESAILGQERERKATRRWVGRLGVAVALLAAIGPAVWAVPLAVQNGQRQKELYKAVEGQSVCLESGSYLSGFALPSTMVVAGRDVGYWQETTTNSAFVPSRRVLDECKLIVGPHKNARSIPVTCSQRKTPGGVLGSVLGSRNEDTICLWRA